MITRDPINPNYAMALLLILFFLLQLPILSQVSTYHSDEHYYTDAAVYMVQHDDYLSPRLNDGTLRSKKPIVTYWMIIAGYVVFGVNFFAARLPFLLAGCFTIWVTYTMALRLFKQHRVALLSAIILASNMQFMVLCLRATPDVVQTLFMNVSLLGFIAIMLEKEERFRNYLYVYIGAALVVQTKGLLGLVLIGFIFTYYIFNKPKTGPRARITHWPVMAIATGIAVSWYVYMFLQHGEGAIWRFYSDQVGGKIDGSGFYLLSNLTGYIWGVFRNFLPWSLVVIAGYIWQRKVIHDAIRQHRKRVVFIVSWFALILVIFIGSTDCRTRYLVPAYPLLAILISYLFWQLIEKGHIGKMWNWLGGAMLALLTVGGLTLTILGAVLQWQVMVCGLILVVIFLAVIWRWRHQKGILSPPVLGVVLFVALTGVRGLVIPTFEFEPSKRIAACLLAEHTSEQPITVWSMARANYLRQLYTLSQGKIMVRYVKRGDLQQHKKDRSPVLFTSKDIAAYPLDDYDVEICGAIFRAPAFDELWSAYLSNGRNKVYESIQNPIYLGRYNTTSNNNQEIKTLIRD